MKKESATPAKSPPSFCLRHQYLDGYKCKTCEEVLAEYNRVGVEPPSRYGSAEDGDEPLRDWGDL